ncbi:hypothetical protein BH09BAC6_BH09BAC6_29790 [soil metagenome]|jgi:hypothetical protein
MQGEDFTHPADAKLGDPLFASQKEGKKKKSEATPLSRAAEERVDERSKVRVSQLCKQH